MSELKYYKLFHRASALTSPEFLSVVEFGNNDEIYDKDEADKVIAHQKYKRCLALYRVCKDNAGWWDYEQRNRLDEQRGNDESLRFKEAHAKFCHYVKWEQRWLELAEKFKEAK